MASCWGAVAASRRPWTANARSARSERPRSPGGASAAAPTSSATAPGGRVRARVRKVRRRFAEAALEQVLEAGPDRVAPPCPYVPRCGGCRLQHLTYDAQLAAKARQAADHLERIAGLDPALVL